MKLELRQLSHLRRQGHLAARAAMSRPRQAAAGMAVALLVAGQFSGSLSSSDTQRLAARIQPTAVDYVRAVDEGLTFPATDLAKDASIAIARREAGLVEAGFARNVTLTEVAETEVVIASTEAEATIARLPQTIEQTDARIEKPILRSKSGETIVAGLGDIERAFAASETAERYGDVVALATTDEQASTDIEAALVRLAREAHFRQGGKPAMSAQAMSEYLSLYVLRERVAAIGQLLEQEPQAPAGGMWVANLDAGIDQAMDFNGFGTGQNSFGAIAGFDHVSQSVFSSGDMLVFGGFVSTFGTASDTHETWAFRSREMRGGSAGGFGVLQDGSFSLSAVVRADFSQTLDSFAANRIDFSDAMQVLKAEVVARYRFAVSDWVVEPSAGVSFAAGRRELAGLNQSSPRYEDAESMKIQLGVKASGVVYNKAGTSVEPSVTIMISEELRDQGDVTFLSSSPTGPSDPIVGKTVGSVSFGFDVKDESGWTGFVRAEGQVSDDDKPKAGVSAGVKTQW